MTYQRIQVSLIHSPPTTTCPVGSLWYKLLIAPVTSGSSLGQLLCFANLSPYVSSTYDSLEAFYQRQGDSGSANAVVAEQMRRDRKLHCFTISSFAFVTCASDIVGWPDNYGRSPERFLYLGALIVVLGAFIFRKSNMQPRKPDPADNVTPALPTHLTHFNELLYSLGLFVPRLHLKIADQWEPKEIAESNGRSSRRVLVHRRFVRGYRVVHKGLGYILVAALLADFSGILK
jgi:hypothetical protein